MRLRTLILPVAVVENGWELFASSHLGRSNCALCHRRVPLGSCSGLRGAKKGATCCCAERGRVRDGRPYEPRPHNGLSDQRRGRSLQLATSTVLLFSRSRALEAGSLDKRSKRRASRHSPSTEASVTLSYGFQPLVFSMGPYDAASEQRPRVQSAQRWSGNQVALRLLVNRSPNKACY